MEALILSFMGVESFFLTILEQYGVRFQRRKSASGDNALGQGGLNAVQNPAMVDAVGDAWSVDTRPAGAFN
jgi:hypothetical protein